MATLSSMLRADYNPTSCLESLRRWKAGSKRTQLKQAFAALMPLVRMARRNKFRRLCAEDAEEIEAYVSYVVWRCMRNKKYPEFDSPRALTSWWLVVIKRGLVQWWRKERLSEAPDTPTDLLLAARNVMTPRDGSRISIENAIFLQELPDAVWKSILDDGLQVEPEEAPALRYITHRWCHGRPPSVDVLVEEFGIEKSRAAFLIDFCLFSVRRSLHLMVRDHPEALLEHPVSFSVEGVVHGEAED